MSQSIIISNQGTVLPEAYTIVGLSSKRNDDSKIGMFGTGTKYAIAVLMRNGYQISIITGEYGATFTTEDKEFRGNAFQQVSMKIEYFDDRKPEIIPMGMSTEMGMQWEVNDGLREFICNARDEGGFDVRMGSGSITKDVKSVKALHKKIGEPTTSIIITSAQDDQRLKTYLKKFDEMFLFNRTAIYISDNISVYKKVSRDNRLRVYRNGVCVLQDELMSVYDYELNLVDLSERRTTDMWQAQYEFSRAVFTLPDELLSDILVRSTVLHFESTGVHYEVLPGRVPRIFQDVVLATEDLLERAGDKLFSRKVLLVPETWYKFLRTVPGLQSVHSVIGEVSLMSGKEYRFDQLSSLEKLTVEKALKFVQDAGYRIELKDLHFNEMDSMGLFRDNQIYISTKYIKNGVYELVNTIIHEIMHRESKAVDESRAFENYLIQEIIKQLMERLQVVL